MSVWAVCILGGCLILACGLGGWQLGWGIRALRPRAAPGSVRTIGLGFLAVEVWALAAITLFPALFPRTEAELVGAGWALIWVALGAWVLRDLALWWWILVDGAPRGALALLLGISSLVMAIVIAGGLGWALFGGAVPALLLVAGVVGAGIVMAWPRTGGVALAGAAATAVALHHPALLLQAGAASSLPLLVPLLSAGIAVVGLLQLGWWSCVRRQRRIIG